MNNHNDCTKCLHYEVCCGWTSKEAIDAANAATDEGVCQECPYFKPLSDVVEIRHGHWECAYDDKLGETRVTCSVCGDYRDINGCFISVDNKPLYREDNYCPCCGADMRG